MYQAPGLWNNQTTMQESPIGTEDSFIILNKQCPTTETREETGETFSIKAKKFKEIQLLRQLNAQSNNYMDVKLTHYNSQGQIFYNEEAIGDEEPQKPTNFHDFEEFRSYNGSSVVTPIASDRHNVSTQGPQSSTVKANTGNKQKADLPPSQSFRIKKDATQLQEFLENVPAKSDVSQSSKKTGIGYQQAYYNGPAPVEVTKKVNSLRDISLKTKSTARSTLIAEDYERDIFQKRNLTVVKPQVFDNKQRPQSKDANRLIDLYNTADPRPNTTNSNKSNKRLIIKSRKSQIPGLGSEFQSPNKLANEHNLTEAFDLSPLGNSPSNYKMHKGNLSPSNSDSRSVRSNFTYAAEVKPTPKVASNGDISNTNTKVLNRVIQPFNKISEEASAEAKEKPTKPPMAQSDKKHASSVDRPLNSNLNSSTKKGRNENVNSNTDNRDVHSRAKNVRAGTKASESVEHNEANKQGKQEDKKKVEQRTPPKVAMTKINNNMKVEQLIRGKRTYNHKTNMTEYLKRRGLKENSKIFCFNSRDEHIRRALKKYGWIENPHPSSFLFDFKWTYNDIEADYANLMEGQYYNHFPNNKEITMKSGLIENLRNCVDHGNDVWSFFPRAYDLGHINQLKEFQEDFERTGLVNLFRKHWKYIKSKVDPQVIKSIKEKFNKKEEKRMKEGIIDIFKRKKLIKVVSYSEETTKKDFVVYTSLLETAVSCARTLVHQHKNIAEADIFCSLSQLNERTRTALLAYSRFNPPYNEIPLATRKSLGGGEEQWETPNELLMYKIYKFKELIKKFSPQYGIDGLDNIWIIKASANARGSGIFLTDRLEEALDSGAKNQARVIQKYMERPLIIQDFPLKILNNKKFDLRQWVLVTSMNPLVIYMFSSCYIRICSQDYDLKDIKNQFSHLTNFSVNKGNFQNGNEESICHLDPLKEYLKTTRNIDWDLDIKPKIVDIIIKTISIASDSIEQRSGCFDMYGFDLLLDNKYQPWLLEVNLSPACAERTPWLTEMLDDMAEGLLKCVLPSDYLQVPENTDTVNKSPEEAASEGKGEGLKPKKPKYNWDLIYKAEVPRDHLGANNIIVLEVAGVKANIKKEQEIDRKYFAHMAAIRIQKTYKMFAAKRKKLFLKQSKVIVVIQKYVRRFLAKAKLRHLREDRATRRIKNLLEIHRMNVRIINFRRQKAAIRIQKHARTYLAKKLFKHMKYMKKIIRIQSFWRRTLAIKRKLELRNRLAMCVRIQRFWKKRFRMLKAKATKIRAYWKMSKARKFFVKFLKRKRAATKIQCATRVFLAKLHKQRLLIARAEDKLKHLRINKYGKELFVRLQLSKKYTKFFDILDAVVLKVSLKAIAARAETRNHNALIIQGLAKIRKAKIRRRRLKRRKMVIRIQTYWRMYCERKKFLMHKKRIQAAIVVQKNVRMYFSKLYLKELRNEKQLEQYAAALRKKLEQERMVEEIKQYEKRKEEMEKKKQIFFKQKDHINYLVQSLPKSKVQTTTNNNNKTNTDSFAEKKKQEILKNTEHMLKTIYKEVPAKPIAQPVKKSSKPVVSRESAVRPKPVNQSKEQTNMSNMPDESKNFDTLFKIFSKNTGFN